MKNKPADIPYFGVDPQRIKAAKPKFNPENLKVFRHYVFERYNIHLKKDIHEYPAPWTDDPILRTYSFTNVRREHDKTTLHLLKLLEEHRHYPYHDKILNIILYRLFNKIETMEKIGWIKWTEFDEDDTRAKLMDFPEGYAYCSNAFLASGTKREMNKQYPDEKFRPINMPKVVNKYKAILAKGGIKAAKTPMDVINTLKQVPGISNFLAYQMFVDFTYLEEFPFSENEFTIAGPGCSRGLNYLFEDRDGLTDEELLFWLRDNCPFTQEELTQLMIDIPIYDRKMNIMSLENCMCELSKYIKVKTGTGRPRSLYRGGC